MRILKWAGIIVALLIIAFFAVGLITPSFSYENRITADAPLEKAFATFMDESKMKQWMPALVKMENISGEARAIGSKWKMTFDQDGEIMEVVEEVTAYEPNARYAFNLDAEPFNGKVDIRFTAIDSNTTEIIATTNVDGKGMIWKSMMALFKPTMQSQTQEQYEMLKGVIEAN